MSGVPAVVLHVLLALIVILAASRLVGAAFRRIGQPRVIGEVFAGIALGPSLLGRCWPTGAHFLLPPDVAPPLSAIAQVGVVVFMFLVGVELDTGLLRRRTGTTLAISYASIVLPFVGGGALGLWLHPRYGTTDVPLVVFALFVGVAMSVTAFPVLARILTDRRIHRSDLGVVALACAAIDDVTAWCLLALVVGVAKAHLEGALATIALSIAFAAFVLLLVRPFVARVVRAQELLKEISRGAIAAVALGILTAALVTEWIGIHAIFGAFAFGAVIPHESRLARALIAKVEDVVVVLLLPVFFATTGLRTQIGLVEGTAAWLACGAIVAVASLGKFGGSFVAARVVGMSTRDAAAIGVLLNTRGLMELVVLNVGLDLHVISPTLFAMMVIMAVATTFATTPILALLTRGDPALAFAAGKV